MASTQTEMGSHVISTAERGGSIPKGSCAAAPLTAETIAAG